MYAIDTHFRDGHDKCEHEPYTSDESRRKTWLEYDSPSHNALRSVILNKQLQKDLEKLNENIFTTYLEVFHALKIRYLPKSIFYEEEKMLAGARLAALDHNYNVDRKQLVF